MAQGSDVLLLLIYPRLQQFCFFLLYNLRRCHTLPMRSSFCSGSGFVCQDLSASWHAACSAYRDALEREGAQSAFGKVRLGRRLEAVGNAGRG